MKLRAAAWAGIVGLMLLAAPCSRGTPANTTSSQGQPMTDQAPQPSPAPAAHEAMTPEKSIVTPVLKTHRLNPDARADTAQSVPPALVPAPGIVSVNAVLTLRVDDAVSAKSSSRTPKISPSRAAASALIGVLSGAGKKAPIGSAARDAGAGSAGSALTGDNHLAIPVESMLQFPLAQPPRFQITGNNPQQLAPNQEGK